LRLIAPLSGLDQPQEAKPSDGLEPTTASETRFFESTRSNPSDDQLDEAARLSCGLWVDILILVVAAPPLVGLGLRVPGG